MTQKKAAPVKQTEAARKGGVAMYTEYGFVKDGVEYATVDEAYEDD